MNAPRPHDTETPSSDGDGGAPAASGGLSRRAWLKGASVAVGAVALTGALAPLAEVAQKLTIDEFLQKHYRELSPAELRAVLARLAAETRATHGVDVTIAAPPPMEGVKFGYAINLSLCNGNGKCVEACHRENNHDRPSGQSYIRVLELDKGSMDMESGNTTYAHAVPAPGKYYLPVQCMQCDNPPCVRVCPVEATWKERDGIVVVDYSWCIGCRYCEAACPYHARRFNWQEPEVPAQEINPDQGYLSNRVRPKGVVEKCHFCLHRTRVGRLPACVEACPTGARVFGNLLDPDSDIRFILENKRVFRLKEDLGTLPSLFYFFDK